MPPLRAIVLSAAVLLASACTTTIETRHRDWSSYDGPGAEAFAAPEPDPVDRLPDPLEPTNRRIAVFNDVLMDVVVRPLTVTWRAVTTKTIRRHLTNAANNLAYPRRLVNNLAQGKGRGAGHETMRFAINTTIGLGGLFDPASGWGWERSDEDTGQTLADAGWSEPTFLTIPVGGPSSTRDAVGLVPDFALDILTWLATPVTTVLRLNQLADLELVYHRSVETSPDPYELMHFVWSVARLRETRDARWERQPPDEVSDTLQAVFLRPEDPDFDTLSGERRVFLPTTKRTLPFNCWKAEGPAPLAICLPGLGSHRLSNHALALAESVCLEGWHAATISSVFHPEYMASAARASVPGDASVDVPDLHAVIDAVVASVRREAEVTHVVVIGLSMGGYHAFHLAATEQQRPELVDVDLYVPVDSPVSLRFAMSQLDDFYRAPLQWPADEREERMRSALGKAVRLGRAALQPDVDLGFTEAEAEFLIGLAFRLTLVDVIWASQRRHDDGVLLTELDAYQRGPAYREIVEYSWLEYAYAFLFPAVAERRPGATAEALFARLDLRALTDRLARNPELFVVTHANDPLLRDDDTPWLESLVPAERLRSFERGGHLGAGSDPERRRAAVRQMRAALR